MIGTTHSKARNVCSVSARYHASSFKAIMRGVPREKARSEPVVSAPPPPRRCPSAARPAAVSSQAPRIARVQQECNRPQTQRRRKRRRENANEIPPTPLYSIPLPPRPAHGSHAANTLQICNERGGFPNDGVLARRPAARQQKGAVFRRESRAIGSRRVFCGPAGLEPPR